MLYLQTYVCRLVWHAEQFALCFHIFSTLLRKEAAQFQNALEVAGQNRVVAHFGKESLLTFFLTYCDYELLQTHRQRFLWVLYVA